MITTEQLDGLESFGKENDTTYSDRYEFSIVKSVRKPDFWDFCHFDEVDGSLFYIKTLRDIDDLKKVYEAITDKELV
jgi:hypothetical protein